GREYNRALVAVERNNHGYTVLELLKRIEDYSPLFATQGEDGWLTNRKTRPPLLERFTAFLIESPESISSRRLLEECRTFIRRADGTPAAAQGTHDDCIFAMAIALAARESECAGDAQSGTPTYSSVSY